MTPAEATAVSGATRPRLRDCPASVRELRARERALCGLHQFDRSLHAFWERLPLRELRIVGTVAVLGVGGYLVVVRRSSIEDSLSRVGSAQPGWIVVAAILIAAILGRRQFVPAALWAVRHLGGRDAPAEQPVAANHLVLLLVLGFLNWLFDAAVLFAVIAAMGQTIPVRGVVVAYTL